MKRLALAIIGSVLAMAQPSLAVEPPAGFILNEAPAVLPDVGFEDDQGQKRQLADFHGKIVLLNLWATWCAPCREEMPTLNSLEGMLGGPDFEVVALSIDRNGLEKVKTFYRDNGITRLAVRVDSSGKAAGILGAVGLPTTILIGRDGRGLGRLIGPAAWDTEEMVDFFRAMISAPDPTVPPAE